MRTVSETVFNGVKAIVISKLCTVKKEVYSVTVAKADIEKWQAGTLLQDAFRYLNADQREFVKTGTTPAEWENIFGS